MFGDEWSSPVDSSLFQLVTPATHGPSVSKSARARQTNQLYFKRRLVRNSNLSKQNHLRGLAVSVVGVCVNTSCIRSVDRTFIFGEMSISKKSKLEKRLVNDENENYVHYIMLLSCYKGQATFVTFETLLIKGIRVIITQLYTCLYRHFLAVSANPDLKQCRVTTSNHRF